MGKSVTLGIFLVFFQMDVCKVLQGEQLSHKDPCNTNVGIQKGTRQSRSEEKGLPAPEADNAASFERRGPDTPLYPVWLNDEKMGYIDHAGKTIIASRFGNANGFSEDLAWAMTKTKKGRVDKWGYINRSGKFVLDTSGSASFFSEGMVPSGVKGKQPSDRLAGFVDKTGKWVISPQFLCVCAFHEGLACVVVVETGKIGYIDTKGTFVIPAEFDHGGDFHEGLARVSKAGDTWGYIDKNGEMVIQSVYNEVYDFDNSAAWVHMGGKSVEYATHQPAAWEAGEWQLIDKTGKVFWRVSDPPSGTYSVKVGV